MSNLNAYEQLMLELTNRARMDPKGEAARYNIDLNEGLTAGTISSAPKEVLAGSDQLGLAADKHSQWMLNADVFAHFEDPNLNPVGNGYYAASPFDRMPKAGYSGDRLGENIAVRSGTDKAQLIYDQHKDLFVDAGVPGRGHRLNLMDDHYREIGVGYKYGSFEFNPGNAFNSSMITQDFGRRGEAVFVTGVVYNDTKTNDNFFTVGEQTAGVKVSGTGVASDTTGTGGGYELSFSTTGTRHLVFDLPTGDVKLKLSVGATSLKVDVVNGKEVWTNASATSESTTIKELHALGVSKMNLTGSTASEKIYGNKAANILSGKDGNDTISGGSGNDTINGGGQHDKLTGGSGDDHFIYKLASESGPGSAADAITDFGDSGADRIDLSAIYSGTLVYKDEAAFTGAHQVRVTASGSDVTVHVNLDGNLATDEMQIVLTTTTLSHMTASDFIL